MADQSFKSKLPDVKEVADMATKLFKDIKKSVTEIAKDYKEKHGGSSNKGETIKKDDEKK